MNSKSTHHHKRFEHLLIIRHLVDELEVDTFVSVSFVHVHIARILFINHLNLARHSIESNSPLINSMSTPDQTPAHNLIRQLVDEIEVNLYSLGSKTARKRPLRKVGDSIVNIT